MKRGFTIFITTFFLAFLIFPFTYLSIATYSYLSVYNTFGKVPFTVYYTPDLVKSTGKNFEIISNPFSDFIVLFLPLVFFFAFTFSLFCYFYKQNNNNNIFRKYAIALAITYTIFFFLLKIDLFGWYFGYVYDYLVD